MVLESFKWTICLNPNYWIFENNIVKVSEKFLADEIIVTALSDLALGLSNL